MGSDTSAPEVRNHSNKSQNQVRVPQNGPAGPSHGTQQHHDHHQHQDHEHGHGHGHQHHTIIRNRNIAPERLELLRTRPSRKYVVGRPRALQYSYQSKVLKAGEEEAVGGNHITLVSTGKSQSDSVEHHVPRIHDSIEKQRDRMDLFIDLIWVGIISNVSELYSSEAFKPNKSTPGGAFLLFMLVFFPTWRIWNGLREIMNNYYMDDILQRIFLFLVLVLSVFYGNNLAFLTEDLYSARTICITLYLIIRATLMIGEAVYSIYIPWLRKTIMLTFVLYSPGIALWVASIYINKYASVGTIFAAIAVDYAVPMILDTPIAGKLIPLEYGKALDPHHFTSRMGSFFIITLGEGVLQLIRDGPLGLGLKRTAGYSVWSLSIYFLLAYIYFMKDSSQMLIPAVVKKGWRTMMWIACHIPIFMSALTLSAGIMFIIRESAQTPDADPDSINVPSDELKAYTRTAMWTVAVSLVTIMAAMTGLAFLDESLDPPGTLRINNRYLRLSGRAVYCVIIICVPADKDVGAEWFLGLCSLLLGLVSSWEWIGSTERGGAFFEPKGLTTMIRHANSNDASSSHSLFHFRSGEKGPREYRH